MFKFYHSQYNPQSLSGLVGGPITGSLVSGYLDELLFHMDSPPQEAEQSTGQYRKIYIKNEHTRSVTDTRLWIDAAQHPDQISLALETGYAQTSTNPTQTPSGITSWSTPTNYANGLNIGDMAVNAYSGIWIRETLTNISVADPYASFRLYVGGIVE